MKIDDLVLAGHGLIGSVEVFIDQNREVAGDTAAKIKALHVKGRLLLRRIDRQTYNEYSSLFSMTFYDEYRWDWHNAYLKTELEKCVGILQAIQEAGLEEALDRTLPQIFISHGGFGKPFEKLENFIRALGCVPVYDTDVPTEGRALNTHVEKLLEISDFYIILATAETIDDKGRHLPNHNVIIEYDRLVQAKTENMIVFLQENCKLPTMVQDVIYVPFTEDAMDIAFTRLVAALRKTSLL